MVLFKKFCCCNLSTGAMILGLLGLTGCIFYTISFLSSVISFEDQIPNNPSVEFRNAIKSFETTMFGLTSIGSVMNVLLIYGAHKNKKSFLLPWLIIKGCLIVLLLATIVCVGIISIKIDEVTLAVVMSIFGLPFIILLIYFWICILSLYQKFNEEKPNNEDKITLTNEPVPPAYYPKLLPYKAVV